MAENGKIYITISDTRGQQQAQQGANNSAIVDKELANHQPTLPSSELSNEVMKDVKMVGATVGALAVQYANWAISNIGNFSGDYQRQREVKAAIGVGAKMGGLAMAMMGGPLTAIAYAGTMAAQFALTETANKIQFAKQNYDISQLRQISGLDGLTNGGRI